MAREGDIVEAVATAGSNGLAGSSAPAPAASLPGPVKTSRGALARKAALCLAAALALVAAVALTGCKYSDVLTQHTEDPDLGTLDENIEPNYVSNSNAELVLDMAQLTVSEAPDENTQVATLPHYDPDAPDNGPTKQLKKSSETPHDEEASQGEDSEEDADRDGEGESEEAGEGGEGDGDNGGKDGTQGDGDKEDDQEEGPGPTLDDDDSDEPQDPAAGGTGGGDVTVDPDGTNSDTSKGSVAAVGEYATIAQMLGGAGALVACDESWMAARKSDGCFSDELDRVATAFKGDGTAAGSCDVDELISTIQPSVVLWDSAANTPNLSDAEQEKLEAAGIEVQAVPHIGEQTTEDYDVKAAVAEVANVLSGASGLEYDPVGVLEQYNEFHDKILKACYDANQGYSYKYVDDMYDYLYQQHPLDGLTDSTTTRFTAVYADEVAKLGSSFALETSAVRETAHGNTKVDTSDGVALSAVGNGSDYQLIDYYLQLSGVMNNSYDVDKAASSRYYLAPGKLNGVSAYKDRLVASYGLFYNGGDGDVESNWHLLGDEGFKTVLAANDDIAQVFVSSSKKSNGLYRMEAPYDVIVVPTGIGGSWAAGHIDSFLLAPWALRIQKDSNLSAAESYLTSFYSTFLRCSDAKAVVQDWDTSYAAQG